MKLSPHFQQALTQMNQFRMVQGCGSYEGYLNDILGQKYFWKEHIQTAYEKAEAEEQREVAEPTTQQETQTALLGAAPVLGIVVDKAEVENDDHLKSVIRKHYDEIKFMNQWSHVLKMHDIEYLSVNAIAGTTFIADIRYRSSKGIGAGYGKLENATVEIEKTADSYKVISFNRKR